MYVIGIDAGATKTRAAIADLNGRTLSSGASGDANIHTTSEREIAAHIRKACAAAKKGLDLPSVPAAVCIGMAGIDSASDKRRAGRIIRAAFPRLGKSLFAVVNDVVIARRSNSDQPFGACVIAGTGSNAYAINQEGEEAFVGGMDWLLTDDGSGYMVGRGALRAAARSEDGRETTSLGKLVKERLGVSVLRNALRTVYSPAFDKSMVASFAPLVDYAAAQGDRVARRILDAASDDLVLMVATAVRRVKLARVPCELVAAGSVLMKSPRIYSHFVSGIGRLFPSLSVVPAENSPVEGAVRIALETLFTHR